MRVQQIVLLIGGLIFVAILFSFGNLRSPEKSAPENGMNQTVSSAGSEIEVADLIAKAKTLLTPIQSDSIKELEALLTATSIDSDKQNILSQLGNRWVRTGNIIIGGYYLFQSANKISDEEALLEAANYLFTGFQSTTDSAARIFGAQQAVKVYEELKHLDSTQLAYPVQQAICYMDGLNEVMSGVMILKEVEKKDSNHIEMNLVLGRFGVRSGQYDKAAARLEKVVELDPSNSAGYFHLAEAYRALGRKQDAISALKKCKELVNDPDFRAGIDNYINQINN